MHTFAHIADVHLGANRDPLMAQCEIDAFLRSLDTCIKRKVDFILICGDLFHLGVPTDLDVVNQAVVKMREVKERGIPIYAIYGSHDYTPTGTSIIDVVESAGLLVKIVRSTVVDGKLRLEYVEDKKTGAKLVGISGRKMSMDRKYYEMLDTEHLERLGGFKIFAFHIGLDEFKPEYLRQMDTVSISAFPKGFDYYAGGHIHERSNNSWPGYERVVFPGTLFAGYGRDLESIARKEKRGFYIVSFADEIADLEFIETEVPDALYHEEDVSGLNSYEAQRKLEESLSRLDVNGKLVVLKLKGILSTGKTSDMNFSALRGILLDNGALQIHLNRYALQSKEYVGVMVGCEDTDSIEERLFQESIGSVHVNVPDLQGDIGLKKSFELLKALRQEQRPSESKNGYAKRVLDNALEVLSIKRLFET